MILFLAAKPSRIKNEQLEKAKSVNTLKNDNYEYIHTSYSSKFNEYSSQVNATLKVLKFDFPVVLWHGQDM